MAGEKTADQLNDEMKKAVISFSDKTKIGNNALHESVTKLQSTTAIIKKKQDNIKENIRGQISA